MPDYFNKEIRIQTTSYGALNEEEFSKFLDCQRDSLRMKNLIESVYKNKSLPIIVAK